MKFAAPMRGKGGRFLLFMRPLRRLPQAIVVFLAVHDFRREPLGLRVSGETEIEDTLEGIANSHE